MKKESPHPSMPEIKIHENGIFKLLNGLNIHKATGPDGIPTLVLKELAHALTLSSINQGSIPDEWKEANVVPIFKKGDKSTAVNYRPVSLTVVLCKVIEHIICSHIGKATRHAQLAPLPSRLWRIEVRYLCAHVRPVNSD